MSWLVDIFSYISSFFSSLITAITSFTRISNQTLGSINAVGTAWNGVSVVGPMIGALILATVAFLVIDLVRDLL